VDGRIIDLKTSKKPPSGISAAHLNQVTTYAMLSPQASGDVKISTLTKGKRVDLRRGVFCALSLPRQSKLIYTHCHA